MKLYHQIAQGQSTNFWSYYFLAILNSYVFYRNETANQFKFDLVIDLEGYQDLGEGSASSMWISEMFLHLQVYFNEPEFPMRLVPVVRRVAVQNLNKSSQYFPKRAQDHVLFLHKYDNSLTRQNQSVCNNQTRFMHFKVDFHASHQVVAHALAKMLWKAFRAKERSKTECDVLADCLSGR